MQKLTKNLASKRAFQKFTKTYDLVYFGYVDQHIDEHIQVRGVSFSTTHKDHHYTTGTVQSRSVTAFERTDHLKFPGKAEHTYDWLIMQFNLGRADMPYLFVDGTHYDETFYENLFLRHKQLINQRAYITNDAFSQKFNVYAVRSTADSKYMQIIFNHEITAMLIEHFQQYDFEVSGSNLIMYTRCPKKDVLSHLEHMLRGGIWLAEKLDALSLELAE